MPLVTITTTEKYFPLEAQEGGFLVSLARLLTDDLAGDLPQLFIDYKEALRLDPDTPLEGVQVDIKQFHHRARNAPDIWLLVVLGEQLEDDHQRRCVAQELQIVLQRWFATRDIRVQWALDVHWVPSHGCLTDEVGIVAHEW